MAQLDLGYILRLNLIDAEANHQVRYNLDLLVGLADNLDRLVDIEKDFFKSLQKVQPLSLFGAIIEGTALDTLNTESNPLVKQFFYSENTRNTCDKHVEVAGVAVLEGGQLEELCHQLVGVGAALEVNCYFETVKTCFVADIRDFLDLALLYEVNDFLNDDLAGG